MFLRGVRLSRCWSLVHMTAVAEKEERSVNLECGGGGAGGGGGGGGGGSGDNVAVAIRLYPLRLESEESSLAQTPAPDEQPPPSPRPISNTQQPEEERLTTLIKCDKMTQEKKKRTSRTDMLTKNVMRDPSAIPEPFSEFTKQLNPPHPQSNSNMTGVAY
ncbi:calpain small subunit 1-like [Rhincodon typus]|uniref:calpain small subunit 1-like n=1 Tax=Rhincodon typus TaxID=259920 RepID=UPI00202F2B5F|nr:calpain small subunit 1-like [Rhincodon typus]